MYKIETYLSILFKIYGMSNRLLNLHYEILERKKGENRDHEPIQCYIEAEKGRHYLHLFTDCQTVRPLKIDFDRLKEMESENIELRNKLERMEKAISLALEM